MRNKVLIAVLVAMMAAILLVSCGGDEDSGLLRAAVAQEPVSLDVMITSSVSGRNIAVGNVYERLFEMDGDTIRPVLATGYELSSSGCDLRIGIRSGVSFHDGTLLDPEDAAASLNRWLRSYKGASSITGDASFSVEGDGIVISSTSSLAMLPVMLASSPQAAVIYPGEAIASAADGMPVVDAPGTGPYRVEEWISGSSILLSAFDGYWGDKPSIERISYEFVPDPVIRRLGLESGQYDFIDNVLSDDIPALEKVPGIELHQGDENGSIVLVFNKKEGISTDVSFRRAVSLLIDREELMRACYGSYGYSVRSAYMDGKDGIWSVNPDLDPYGMEDREEGLALLQDSYDGTTVRILSSNLTDLDRIAIALSSELEQCGINTELIILDWASFMEQRGNPSSWDIYVSATGSVPLPLEKGYLFSDSPGGFDDPSSSSIIRALSTSESMEEAAALWQIAQIRLWEYVPVIVPGHYSTVYASRSISGIDLSDGFHFRDAVML